jgi:hypothetical protein
MEQARAKKARDAPSGPPLPALPDVALHKIFALAESEKIRALRLLHAALKEASAARTDAGEPRPCAFTCGLVASESLYRALQTAPADAGAGADPGVDPPAGAGAGAPAADATLGQLLQRAAWGWMLQSDMPHPAGPEWAAATAPPDLASGRYGRGAAMDARGARAGVTLLYRELMRGCVDLAAVDKQWLAAWRASETAEWCSELRALLAAVGRQVRLDEAKSHAMPQELRQRTYNTQHGPVDAAHAAATLASEARERAISDLEGERERLLQNHELHADAHERLRALLAERERATEYLQLPEGKRLPPVLPAYEAKLDGDSRQSDSYVGLFALVQLAAAAAVGLALHDRARATMRSFLAQLSDADKNTPVHTPADFERLRAGNDHAPVVQFLDDETHELVFALQFQQGTVYRAAVGTAHTHPSYGAVWVGKTGHVSIVVNKGRTPAQMLQQLESAPADADWLLEVDANTADQPYDAPQNPQLCPTVEYIPDYADWDQAPTPADGVPWVDPSAGEWVVHTQYHNGPLVRTAHKMTGYQPTYRATALTLAVHFDEDILSLMHYLPPRFAPVLSLPDLLGGLQQ